MSSVDPGVARSGNLLAIGNFDGVHRGHQFLIRRVIEEARSLGLRPTVMTFDPHPSQVLGRTEQPVLTRLPHKLARLRGISPELHVIVETFDHELAAMSPEQFARVVLRERHDARRVIVGSNFRFGRARAGNLATLQRLGGELGFSADALDLMLEGQQPISSTRIRQLVKAGDVRGAAALLGEPHVLWGTVVSGRRLGRQLGFPTANLADVAELLPKSGVYACRVRRDEAGTALLPAVCNIGTNPTVGSHALGVEVHLLDFDGDLYGQALGVQLIERLRDEVSFDHLDALRLQIESDARRAAELLDGSSVEATD